MSAPLQPERLLQECRIDQEERSGAGGYADTRPISVYFSRYDAIMELTDVEKIKRLAQYMRCDDSAPPFSSEISGQAASMKLSQSLYHFGRGSCTACVFRGTIT